MTQPLPKYTQLCTYQPRQSAYNFLFPMLCHSHANAGQKGSYVRPRHRHVYDVPLGRKANRVSGRGVGIYPKEKALRGKARYWLFQENMKVHQPGSIYAKGSTALLLYVS